MKFAFEIEVSDRAFLATFINKSEDESDGSKEDMAIACLLKIRLAKAIESVDLSDPLFYQKALIELSIEQSNRPGLTNFFS